MRADAQRVTNGTSPWELADGWVVEVVVVVVRDEHDIDRRKFGQAHRHRLEALGSATRDGDARGPPGRRARAAVDLDQHRRVSEPGGAGGGRCRACAARPRAGPPKASTGWRSRRVPPKRNSGESAVGRSGRSGRGRSGAGCETRRPQARARIRSSAALRACRRVTSWSRSVVAHGWYFATPAASALGRPRRAATRRGIARKSVAGHRIVGRGPRPAKTLLAVVVIHGSVLPPRTPTQRSMSRAGSACVGQPVRQRHARRPRRPTTTVGSTGQQASGTCGSGVGVGAWVEGRLLSRQRWTRPSGLRCGCMARRDDAAGSCPRGGTTQPACPLHLSIGVRRYPNSDGRCRV